MKLRVPKIKTAKKYRKQIKLLNFLIRLNIFAIPLYVILILDLSLPQLQHAVADITFYLLSAAGFDPAISGLLISIPITNGSWAAFISWDCTAWKSMLAFLALVMATDYKSKSKWKGLAIFIPAIFVVNILRIFFMFYFVKTYDLAYYAFVHAVVWSWGMIFVILAFWLIWLKKMK
jgi:exosortase/archaeosortase family protein